MIRDDFDTVLRSALTDAANATQPDPDLADRLVRATRPGRVRTWRWTTPLLAAAAVIALVVGIAAVVHADLRAARHQDSPGAQRGAGTALSSTPALTSFHAANLYFADAEHGWALGDAACPSGRRAELPGVADDHRRRRVLACAGATEGTGVDLRLRLVQHQRRRARPVRGLGGLRRPGPRLPVEPARVVLDDRRRTDVDAPGPSRAPVGRRGRARVRWQSRGAPGADQRLLVGLRRLGAVGAARQRPLHRHRARLGTGRVAQLDAGCRARRRVPVRRRHRLRLEPGHLPHDRRHPLDARRPRHVRTGDRTGERPVLCGRERRRRRRRADRVLPERVAADRGAGLGAVLRPAPVAARRQRRVRGGPVAAPAGGRGHLEGLSDGFGSGAGDLLRLRRRRTGLATHRDPPGTRRLDRLRRGRGRLGTEPGRRHPLRHRRRRRDLAAGPLPA